jgi:hypothetical protein
MSALPSEADIRVGLRHVCFVPDSDINVSAFYCAPFSGGAVHLPSRASSFGQ